MAAFSSIALGLALGGLGLQAYGQVRAGRAARKVGIAQQEAAESQAELSELNALLAEQQADDATRRGFEAENRFRSEVRGIVGSNRAVFAGGNIDLTSGTPLAVERDVRRLGELDKLTIRTNAARESWGFKTQAFDLRRRAIIARKEGAFAAEAGRANATSAYIGAASTLAGGAGSLLMARYGFGNRTTTTTY